MHTLHATFLVAWPEPDPTIAHCELATCWQTKNREWFFSGSLKELLPQQSA